MWLTDVFNWLFPVPEKRIEPTIQIEPTGRVIEKWACHGWGNSICHHDDGRSPFEIYGWMTPLIAVGDEIRWENMSGGITCAYVKSVENCSSPRDMFFAKLEKKICGGDK